ncbi:hypothetical protein ACFL35_09535 [Candidatus Riflebacteria bacterium]
MKNTKKKVTMIEIMIAVVIMSIGILPFMVLFRGTHTQTAQARNYLLAIYLGRNLLDEARFTPFHLLQLDVDKTFHPVEGDMIPAKYLDPGADATLKGKLKWAKSYKNFSYNLKKLPIQHSKTMEIIAYKLELTIKWLEKKKEKQLRFGTIVARLDR